MANPKVNASGSDGNVEKYSPLWMFEVCKHWVEKELVNVCWAELAVVRRNKNENTLIVKFIDLLNSFQKEKLEITSPEMQ